MFSVCLACTDDGGIGWKGSIPWNIPEDLKRFKELTHGGVVIMGRETWESLPKKPLPGRVNIILSRRGQVSGGGGIILYNLDSALVMAKEMGLPAFVIGGSRLYNEALMRDDCEKVYRTRVEGIWICDRKIDMGLLESKYIKVGEEAVGITKHYFELWKCINNNSVP